MQSLRCPTCNANTASEMGDFDYLGNRIRKRKCNSCGFLGVSVEAWAPPEVLFADVAMAYRETHRLASRRRRGSKKTGHSKRWYALDVVVRKYFDLNLQMRL